MDSLLVIFELIKQYFATPEGLAIAYITLLEVLTAWGVLKNTIFEKRDRVLVIAALLAVGLLAAQFGLSELSLEDFIVIFASFAIDTVWYKEVLKPKGILVTPDGVEKA